MQDILRLISASEGEASTLTSPHKSLNTHHLLSIESRHKKYGILLEASTYSIGRDQRNSITLPFRWISRQHAILLRVTTPESNHYAFRIIDGDFQGNRSTNGLWVNGKRCSSHDLKNGDRITFGKEITANYHILTAVSDEGIQHFIQTGELPSKQPFEHDGMQTVTFSESEEEKYSETALFRLASFPELIPTPIIEVSLAGQITYLNPAALKQFPTLQNQQLAHLLLQGLNFKYGQEENHHSIRAIKIGQQIFQQYIHYLYESDLIRCYIFDVTEQKRVEMSLRRSEAKNRALLNAIPDLILQVNSAGDILDFKPAKAVELETPGMSIVHKNLRDVFPTEIAQQMMHYIKRTLQSGETQSFEYELLQEQATFNYEVRIVTSSDNEVLIIIRDITERKILEKQLIHDALHDALTGLSNRHLFMNHLGHVFDLAKRRENYLYAVLFIDLDRFKVINDSLGHLIGDQLLVGIARRLEACLRTGDTVARLGGDEFAILLEDICSIEDAIQVAERLQHDLAQPFHLDSHEVFTTASVGIASGHLGYERPEELLRDADTAMYHAKSLGKARYELFDQTMHARVVAFLQLDNDLRRAVERQEFQLYYQPIVSLQTGKLTGFETLVRWRHPERGLISPDEFIQIAEETGLIIPLGEWILYEACHQAHQWHLRFPSDVPLSISVNLSGKQFSQPNLAEQIGQILHRTSLDPRQLKLEITESVIMENSHLSTNTLMQLKALGLELCIDDFGTGYSSLSYLHRFPIDILKADRSFVSTMDLGDDDNSRLEITQTIVLLAHKLGIKVVAEGVESNRQLTYLKGMGCEYGQGYYFSKPLNRDAAEALLRSHPRW